MIGICFLCICILQLILIFTISDNLSDINRTLKHINDNLHKS